MTNQDSATDWIKSFVTIGVLALAAMAVYFWAEEGGTLGSLGAVDLAPIGRFLLHAVVVLGLVAIGALVWLWRVGGGRHVARSLAEAGKREVDRRLGATRSSLHGAARHPPPEPLSEGDDPPVSRDRPEGV